MIGVSGVKLWLAVMMLALGAEAAFAQSADLVLCDRIAASPSDPDKPREVAGVPAVSAPDVPTAIKFCGAASRSSRRAMYQLGRAYEANRQLGEAAAAYRKAADKGSTAAMVDLGVLYAGGAGVPADREQARRLFERAAEAGNARGVSNLASLSGGSGAAADPARQRALLSRSADQGSAEAQYQLGMLLADGAGGAKDETGARGLFEKAAAQNHPGALLRMGDFAQEGRGGAQDKDAAKAYYTRAADLGSEDAKTALKKMGCPFTIRDKRGQFVSDLCF